MTDPYKLLKLNYLNRYNYEQRDNCALNSGIISAVKRNPTYTESLTKEDRERIRDAWSEKLEKLGRKYKKKQNEDQYIADVIELKNYMNSSFPDSFNNENPGYDNEFRISHAQKSLSVYLKHLWCMGKIEEPPICPIDRIVLTRVGLKGHNAAWGYINTPELLDEKIKAIQREKGVLSFAVWELLNF
jgi:hypothetical protein